MLQTLLRFLGRIVRNTVVTLLTFVCLIWAADAFLGIGPGDRMVAAVESRLWTLSERAGAAMEDVAGGAWDEQTVLGWRTRRTISLLEREIEQLKWVEAESMTREQAVGAQLADLSRNLETTRNGLVQLAQLMRQNPQAIYVGDVRYEGEQIEAYATQQMIEFSALQEQVELYRQAQSTHRNAALDARALWMEAAQNIQTLEAHSTLLEATMALESTRTPGNEASRNVHQMSDELRSQLERNRRIVQRRHLLEDGFDQNDNKLVDLGSLLTRSEDLAAALERVVR